MFSPDSYNVQTTKGSDLANFLIPSTNLGRSAGFFGLTATLTTGETEYFMDRIECAYGWSEEAIVPVLIRYWSIPANATVFPQGTSGIYSTVLPIISTVLVIFFS